MQDDARKKWLEMCAEAAICEDRQRLEQLTEQIAALLRAEKQRLDLPQMKTVRTAP
jgi:hypothetical protein